MQTNCGNNYCYPANTAAGSLIMHLATIQVHSHSQAATMGGCIPKLTMCLQPWVLICLLTIFIAAKTVGFKTDFPFVPLMLEMRWTSFGIKLSKRFSASAAGEWECLTMLSKHSLFVLMPYLGSPIIAVQRRKRRWNKL